MGIPSYFSNIIKKHQNIVRKVDEELYEHLYIDSNSIIYDSFYAIKYDIEGQDIESLIISSVIQKIKEYIILINPQKTLFIAVDGICPLSKMDQQKTRRFKSSYLSFPKKIINSWSTTNITPGTDFMNKLTQQLNLYFLGTEIKFGVDKVIVSSSDIVGEGEQKIFEHIRSLGKKCINETSIVYGLDADLLMLSFLHISRMKNIFIFREAPDFIKNFIPIIVDPKVPDMPFLIDIKLLSKSIILDMQPDLLGDQSKILDDYVFLCFFLGNDFLPHHPSLNIRTHGIQILIDIYVKYIGKYKKQLVDVENGKIIWESVSILISNLANIEHDLILKEYVLRDKQEQRKFPENTEKEMENAYNNIPLIYRSEEKYICPQIEYWEDRYYNTLFSLENSKDKKGLCDNYFEGLEWVFKYYTQKCPDWHWKYKENYPPLFIDLNKFVPRKYRSFIKPNSNNPLSSLEQLIYVLPRSQLHLLPKITQEIIIKDYVKFYPDKYDVNIIFSFCKYFWESHVELPKMSILNLQDIRRESM
jgi:5'-3' exonuclease